MIHVMLPAQYLQKAGARIAEPWQRLMVAVLQAAINDCQTPPCGLAGVRRRTALRVHREAVTYVASTDRVWPFSFENLCEAIGLDAVAMRRVLQSTAARV